jgi:hypothetical protein
VSTADLEARRLRSAAARAASIATKKSRVVKREAAIDALNNAKGNVVDAAIALGVARSTLQGHLLTWPGELRDDAGKMETLRAWAERTWPRREWDARYGARSPRAMITARRQ